MDLAPRQPRTALAVFERERELAVLAEAVTAAAAGEPRPVIVEGPAGILGDGTSIAAVAALAELDSHAQVPPETCRTYGRVY